MKPLFLALALSANFLIACAQTSPDRMDPAAFKARVEQGHVQLVDVRTPEEYVKGHLDGATNIDWLADDFMANTAKLDKTKPVLLYCAAGGRSEEALNALKKAGFTDVHDMVGGINAWKKAGSPVTTK